MSLTTILTIAAFALIFVGFFMSIINKSGMLRGSIKNTRLYRLGIIIEVSASVPIIGILLIGLIG